MKVLIWTDVFPTFSETFIRDHIIGLIDRGLGVHVYTSKKDKSNIEALNDYQKYNLFDKIFSEEDYLPKSFFIRIVLALYILMTSFFSWKLIFYVRTINYFQFKKKAISLRYFFLLNFIIKNKIDIIHAHFGTNGRKLVFVKQIKYPIKLITTFHGYDIRIDRVYAVNFYKDLFDYSDNIISISNFNKQNLLSFGLNVAKICSINNGVKVPKKPSSFINESKETIEILSIGRLVNDKNYKLAIEALELLKLNKPNFRFNYHIVGDGSLLKDLQKQVLDSGLENNITFYGKKTTKFIRTILRECHFLMLSSINEALPTVILEAQSFGLPVLATNVGSIKDLVNDKNGVLVEPDLQSFYNGLLQIISIRNSWSDLGLKGRMQIKKDYDFNYNLDKIVSCYKSS